ncbi:n-acetylglucosaminyl-phosphatidylinositol de-n-acetylase [Anaeramoeba ignava]|uniref:N-acetylglucosaminylphosphatidylinositol deacetylase n=1 Tax=Anaeramoeba ignava TaxID=1746090 RepID=A0A9Q0R4A5_ANAIG|nr:n-acetylglucosaminyl-phosphatidylinositol de-n-acetylase [Anaeramoeba ignava]
MNYKIFFFLFWILTPFIIYYSINLFHFNEKQIQKLSNNYNLKSKKVLLIFAHPDDECMFFGTTIQILEKNGFEIHWLCLSTGNYRNQGEKRKIELLESGTIFNIPKNKIHIYDHPQIQDGYPFNESLIAEIIENEIDSLDINFIITFDENGISNHKNHISIFNSIQKVLEHRNNNKIPGKSLLVLKLKTVSVFRKYLSFLDFFLDQLKCLFFNNKNHFSITFFSLPFQSIQAMLQHKSQLVWFRYLYVIFSRYMFLNTLELIE